MLLTLRAEPRQDGTTGLVPVVDGRSLVELVTQFEQEQGFEIVGGYGGVAAHVLPVFLTHGRVRLLECACGDAGCWPLHADVTHSGTTVTWSGFQQPRREGHDYTGFGPLAFDRSDYVAAVREAGVREARGHA